MKSTAKNKNKPDIVYGEVGIPAQAFQPRNVKERVTMCLDEDIVDYFRAEAERTGGKYQTLINQVLRAIVDKASNTVPAITKEERAAYFHFIKAAVEDLCSQPDIARKIVEAANLKSDVKARKKSA